MATEEHINPHVHRLALRSTKRRGPYCAPGMGVLWIDIYDDYWQCLDCGKEWHPDLGHPFPKDEDYRGPSVPEELQRAITAVDNAIAAAS